MPDNPWNIADAFSQGFRISLAKQQQKSAEAERAARERELNARISQIDLKSRQITDEIATSAREDAELLQIDTGIAKARTAWEAEKAEGTAGPDPDWSLIAMQELAPVAHRNSKARGIMEDMAKIEATKALSSQREESTRLRSEAMNRMTPYQEFQADLAERRFAQEKEGKATTFEKELDHYEKTTGRSLSPDELEDIYKVHFGVAPRASAAGDWPERAKMTDLYAQRRQAMKDLSAAESLPSTSKTRAEQISTQMRKVRRISEELEAVGASEAKATRSSGPPRITTKADYDKLKSGTTFIGSDGKTWIKP